jgi:EpsI family protein
MQHFLVTDHYYFGWGVFTFFWAPVILVDRRLQRLQEERICDAAVRNRHEEAAQPSDFETGVSAWLAIAVLGAAIWLSHGLTVPQLSARAEAVQLPAVAGWRLLGGWSDAFRPAFLGASAEGSASYGRDGRQIDVYLAHFAAQSQGHEVVYFANRPEGEGGETLSKATVGVEGREAPFTELEVADRDDGRRLVWFEYRVTGQPVAGEIEAKLRQASGALLGRRDAQALVLSADCASDCARARLDLGEFAREAVEPIYATVGDGLRATSGGGL